MAVASPYLPPQLDKPGAATKKKRNYRKLLDVDGCCIAVTADLSIILIGKKHRRYAIRDFPIGASFVPGMFPPNRFEFISIKK